MTTSPRETDLTRPRESTRSFETTLICIRCPAQSVRTRAPANHVNRSVSCGPQVTEIDYQRAENMVLRRGFQKDQLERMLDEYCDLNLLQLDPTRTTISFVT